MFAFMETGLVGYMDGSIKAPSVNANSKEKNEWLQYNSHIVDDSLAQELTLQCLGKMPGIFSTKEWLRVASLQNLTPASCDHHKFFKR